MIPEAMAAFALRHGSSGAAWVERLPQLIEKYSSRWDLDVEGPLPGAGRAAWVGAATTADGADVVLKLAWPHPEAETEAAGLRFFAGRAAVRLLDSDEGDFALLLERLRPGRDLWSLPDTRDADEAAAVVLAGLWRAPTAAATAIGALADRIAFFAGRLGLDRHRIASWMFVKSVGWNWGPRVARLCREVADDLR